MTDFTLEFSIGRAVLPSHGHTEVKLCDSIIDSRSEEHILVSFEEAQWSLVKERVENINQLAVTLKSWDLSLRPQDSPAIAAASLAKRHVCWLILNTVLSDSRIHSGTARKLLSYCDPAYRIALLRPFGALQGVEEEKLSTEKTELQEIVNHFFLERDVNKVLWFVSRKHLVEYLNRSTLNNKERKDFIEACVERGIQFTLDECLDIIEHSEGFEDPAEYLAPCMPSAIESMLKELKQVEKRKKWLSGVFNTCMPLITGFYFDRTKNIFTTEVSIKRAAEIVLSAMMHKAAELGYVCTCHEILRLKRKVERKLLEKEDEYVSRGEEALFLLQLKGITFDHNLEGHSPLHVAVKHNHPRVAKLLVTGGLAPFAQENLDSFQQTAFDYALCLGRKECLGALLEKYHPDRDSVISSHLFTQQIKKAVKLNLDWAIESFFRFYKKMRLLEKVIQNDNYDELIELLLKRGERSYLRALLNAGVHLHMCRQNGETLFEDLMLYYIADNRAPHALKESLRVALSADCVHSIPRHRRFYYLAVLLRAGKMHFVEQLSNSLEVTEEDKQDLYYQAVKENWSGIGVRFLLKTFPVKVTLRRKKLSFSKFVLVRAKASVLKKWIEHSWFFQEPQLPSSTSPIELLITYRSIKDREKKIILLCRKHPDYLRSKNTFDDTPLHLLAKKQMYSYMYGLIRLGASLSARNAVGLTPRDYIIKMVEEEERRAVILKDCEKCSQAFEAKGRH